LSVGFSFVEHCSCIEFIPIVHDEEWQVHACNCRFAFVGSFVLITAVFVISDLEVPEMHAIVDLFLLVVLRCRNPVMLLTLVQWQ
jgi:hypothetical protein